MAKQKPVLNKADLSLLKRIFATKTDAAKRHEQTIKIIFKYLDRNFVTKDELNELKDKIDKLPTKQEFFNKMDEVIGEYKKFQQERDVIPEQYERVKRQLNIS